MADVFTLSDTGVVITNALKDEVYDLKVDISTCTTGLQQSIDALWCSLSDLIARVEELEYQLRPVSVTKTENPKSKDDLEIFNSIVINEDFLNFSDNMFLRNL